MVNLKTGEERAPSSLSGENIHAVVGISNPERFFTALTDLGCMITPHQFPDHHAFQASDIDFTDDRIVVMTEKDAVKLDSLSLEGDDYWYLEVNAIFETSVFDTLLKEAGLQTQALEAAG